MKLLLESQNHRNVEIPMRAEDDVLLAQENNDPLASNIYVCNDYEYTNFSLEDSNEYVSAFYINDEAVKIERISSENNRYEFRCERPPEKASKDDKKIFIQCFGVIRIKAIIDGKTYISDNISIMVTDSSQNKNVIKMIKYVYNKGEKYLYEKDNITSEKKFRLLKEVTEVYEQFYQYFQNSPKTKSVVSESVGKFYKLDSVSPKTIQYIASHPEELYEVNFNTGINYGNRHFQPENTLISTLSYTRNVYENRILVGFISTIISELEQLKADMQKISFSNDVHREGEYFESKKYIYCFRKKSSDEYIKQLDYYIKHFQLLWFRYRKIFNIENMYIDHMPHYTDTFRLIMPYRAVYQVIYEWFQYDRRHSFSESQLLLSFGSTSKIYEYYCLIKIIATIRDELQYHLIEEKTDRYEYGDTKFYLNTCCNNTFVFRGRNGNEITLYFQPVIYGTCSSSQRPNGIMLYRNRTTNSKLKYGNTYTPDYLLKISRNGSSKYVIMDAKFSLVSTVETNLAELVYKYLFSISTLNDNDSLEGMLIMCGKEEVMNKCFNLHNVSENMNKYVSPFSYIANLSGKSVDDNKIIRTMLLNLLK